jgi:hypothetical protein
MKSIVLLFALLLVSCSENPPADVPAWVGKYKNACLPEAIAMQSGLRGSGIESKVLIVQTDKWNHAVCVYVFNGKLFVWDSYWKSNQVRAWFDNPIMVAREWLELVSDAVVFKNGYYL